MLGYTFSVMSIISLICAFYNGRIPELSRSVFDGAANAVTLTLGLLGMMSLWCGVMNLLVEAGVIKRLSKLISPLLKLLFPTACKTGNGVEECSANIAANLLGIGNAATPLALSALEKMQADNPDKSAASDDMVTLAVMNSSSVNFLPITLITMRTLAGSQSPTKVVPAIWICSLCGCAFSVLVTKILAPLYRRKPRK